MVDNQDNFEENAPNYASELKRLKGISIGSMNIRSTFKHLDELEILLQESSLNILMLQETFLNYAVTDPIIEFEGYYMFRNDRDARSGKNRGGGLLTYVSNKYTVSIKDDWCNCSPDIEIQWLVLSLKDTRDTYIANIYRQPSGNIDNFIETLENRLFEIMSLGNKDIIHMGDINIDLTKNDSNARKIKDLYKSHQLEQLIQENTRTTKGSQTLIDYACVNRSEMYYQHGVIEAGISDHALIYVSHKKFKIKQETSYTWARSYRNYDVASCQYDIDNTDWSSVLETDDPNIAVNNFYRIILNIIEKHTPHKFIKSKGPKPAWFTNELLSLIAICLSS